MAGTCSAIHPPILSVTLPKSGSHNLGSIAKGLPNWRSLHSIHSKYNGGKLLQQKAFASQKPRMKGIFCVREEFRNKVEEVAVKLNAKIGPGGGDGTNGNGASSSPLSEIDVNDRPKLISYDYGFQAEFLRDTPTVPGNIIKLAFENFGREWMALRRNYLYVKLSDIRTDKIERSPVALLGAITGRFIVGFVKYVDKFLTLYDGLPEIKPAEEAPDETQLREKLRKLTLDNAAVWKREHARERVAAPWIILAPYYALCLMLDVIYYNRPIQRFWFLETVARMPYFSYISMLHLYETLGWWRSGADVRKVHFAEEWNEMHHLKIMESLGGDELWIDRFFGQHAAIAYYWVLNGLFIFSPKVAYNFSELLEMHAVDTYGTFVDENELLLKSLPPSPMAIAYYGGDDLYMFDEFQTSRPPETRRPVVNNLYDVFSAIRDDEGEHVKTMVACQQLETAVVSPNRARSIQRREEEEARVKAEH